MRRRNFVELSFFGVPQGAADREEDGSGHENRFHREVRCARCPSPGQPAVIVDPGPTSLSRRQSAMH